MQFIELTVENFMGLKALRVRPEGKAVVLGGDNAAGKSSGLQAFLAAIGGKKACPSEPVRKGEDRAEIILDLDEIVVKRVFRASGTTDVVVESKEGAVFRSPQALLDGLFNEVTVEPEKLLTDATSRRELLRALVGESLDAGDAERARLYEERRDLNREVKRLQAHAASIEQALPVAADQIPTAPVSSADILARIRAIEEANREIDREERERQQMDDRLAALTRQLDKADETILQLETELARIVAIRSSVADAMQQEQSSIAALPSLPTRQTTDALAAQLSTIEQTNAAVRDRDSLVAARQAAADAEAASAEKTARIDAIDAEQTAALAAAIEGVVDLGWAAGDLVYHGVPFAQCSTTEGLTVVVELAMAANPKLRAVLVRNGSLLDEAHVEHILTMCDANGYIPLIERVGHDKFTTIYLRDGEVGIPSDLEHALATNPEENSNDPT